MSTLSDIANNISNVFGFSSTSETTTSDLITNISNLSLNEQSLSTSDSSFSLTTPTTFSTLPTTSTLKTKTDDSSNSEVFFENYSSEISDIDTSQRTEIESFLSLFNGKYGFQIKSLDSVIPSIDSILAKKEKIALITSNATQKKNDEFFEIKKQKENLEIELEKLTKENNENRKENEELRAKNENLQKLNDLLQKEQQNLHNSMAQLQEMMNLQLNDLVSLGDQRTKLVQVVNKQMQVIQSFESIKPVEKVREIIRETPKQENTNESNDYLFAQIATFLDKNHKPELINEIRNSSSAVNAKIMNIVELLVNEIKEKDENLDKSNNDIKEMNAKNEFLQEKCSEMIAMFRSEVQFMENFANSSDTQMIVRGKESTEEMKSQLVRQFCLLTKYVDETIGKISLDKFNETLTCPYDMEASKVFDLISSHDIEAQLEEILDHVNEQNIEAKEVVNVLAAQMFINNILKAHVNDLHSRIAIAQREVVKARDSSKLSTTEEDNLKKIIAQMEKQMLKVKKLLLKIVPEQKEPIYETLKRAIRTLAENHENAAQSNSKKTFSSIKPLSSSLVNDSKDDELRKKLKEAKILCKELDKKLNEETEAKNKYASQCKKLHKENQKLKAIINETQHLKQEVDEKLVQLSKEIEFKESEAESAKAEVDASKNENSILKDKYEEQVGQLSNENSKLKQKQSENDSKVSILSKKVENYALAVKTLKKQKKVLSNQILSLKSANKMLQDTVECQAARTQRECSDAIAEYQVQIANSKRELEKLRSSNEELAARNKQLQTEIATSSAARKTSELKLRNAEERFNLERKCFESQSQTRAVAEKAAQNSLIQKFNNERESIKSTLEGLVSSDEHHETINDIISALTNELSSLRESHSLFVSSADSMNHLQRMFNVNSPQKVIQEVNLIKQENEQLKREEEDKKSKVNAKNEEEKQKRSQRQIETATNSLKNWESWGRRLNGIVHSGDTNTAADSAEIRASLEECIISCMSNQTAFERINSLRSQKKILAKFDRRLLKHAKSSVDIRNMIIVFASLRRMQKLAGCIPLAPFASSDADM